MGARGKAYVDTSALIAFLDRSDTYHATFTRLFSDPPPLVTTPLMTTMVVSVQWGETVLPRERARLYEAAVKVILQAQYNVLFRLQKMAM